VRHRVIPTKAERWQQLIDGIGLRRRKQKGNNAGRKNSTYCPAVPIPIQGAVCLPVLYLRLRRPHFDRHPSGTLEAGKLRAPVNSVKSRVVTQRCKLINGGSPSVPEKLTAKSAARDSSFIFPRTGAFIFLVKKIFVHEEK
jgi:hypothetical protein